MVKDTIIPASLPNIQMRLEVLSKFNSTPGEGVTRLALSPEDMAGRLYVKNEMMSIGLEVTEDAVGNIFGTLPGKDRSLAPVWTGSHLDTVRNGGQFDGMAGVICGMEALRMIRQSNLQPLRDISVVAFTSEEAARYGMGCIGSRALAGTLRLEDAETLFDESGTSLKDQLELLGFDVGAFPSLPRKKGDVHAMVELHIEQGAVLERNGKSIGVVHTISAPTEMHVSVSGQQSHAGATPMDLRRDPMPAAATIILELESIASSYANPSTVGTVGSLQVWPNSSNVIPSKVEFSIDIRSSNFEEKSSILEKLKALFARLEKERGVSISYEIRCDDYPALASKEILEDIREACTFFDYSHMDIASGAYHDSLLVSEFAPFGMIFLPSKDGISHDRNEWTDYEDLEKGTNVLARTLWKLAGAPR